MRPATAPPSRPLEQRLLVVDPRSGRFSDARVAELPEHLAAGDLLVVNDAATLPASLLGTTALGAPLELRLAAEEPSEVWLAAVFGEGDWHTRTEDRPPPPRLGAGDRVTFGHGLEATVVAPAGERRVRLRFDRSGAALWSALYRAGRPVQYAHLTSALALWDVQTSFAARPWAVELPSAGRPLTWGLLLSAIRRGVELAPVTHAAGLSSVGPASLDATLPWDERFEVPEETVAAIARTKAHGGRVVAVGTTVVRALEGAAARGPLVGGTGGVTGFKLGPTTRPRVVDGLLTGIHELGSSHFELLRAFAQEPVLRRAWAHAEAEGYLGHEFGDSSLILPGREP